MLAQAKNDKKIGRTGRRSVERKATRRAAPLLKAQGNHTSGEKAALPRVSLASTILAMQPTHGDKRKANTVRDTNTVPTLQGLMDIPASIAGVYELRPEEIKTVRSRVYSLNKHNVLGWRWRTMVEPGNGRTDTLMIWRIR